MGSLRHIPVHVPGTDLHHAGLLPSRICSRYLSAAPLSSLLRRGGSRQNTEGDFRPFTRELSEFKFWWRGTRATGVALAMTFLSMFDVPVYWPILFAYLIFVVVLTIRNRVKYMIKQKHEPVAGTQALLASS